MVQFCSCLLVQFITQKYLIEDNLRKNVQFFLSRSQFWSKYFNAIFDTLKILIHFIITNQTAQFYHNVLSEEVTFWNLK